MEKKDLLIDAQKLVSIIDFLKWTSSFGTGDIQQMEVPLPGVQLGPALSDMFAIAQDSTGLMLTMHEQEAGWLKHLPIECGFVGFDDNLIICIEPMDMLDVPFERTAISIFITSLELRKALAESQLLGFGVVMDTVDGQRVVRTNRIVPMYNPVTYEARKARSRTENKSSLFGA